MLKGIDIDIDIDIDVAERYHLPGLKSKTVEYASNYSFPKEKLLETFQLAEQVLESEFSEALLHNCEDFLLAIIGTPQDYNKFMRENTENMTAFRLLARVNHSKMAFVNTECRSIWLQEAVTYVRNIKRSIRPRHFLQKLITLLKKVKDATDKGEEPKKFLQRFIRTVVLETDEHMVIANSLKKTLEWDTAQAAEKGAALTWRTKVGDIPGVQGSLTCKKSVEMHLKLMQKANRSLWDTGALSVIWDLLVSPSTVPEAKECFINWMITNFETFNKEERVMLFTNLSQSTDALKDFPGYIHFHTLVCLETCRKSDSDESDSDQDL